MKLAYRYRFYPTAEQSGLLARTFGCVQYVYNFGLELRQRAWNERGENVRYKDTSAALTVLKQREETAWLQEVSAIPLQQALRHLDKAFTAFFDGRSNYPRFKRKGGEESAEFTRSAFRYELGKDGQPVLRLAKMSAPLRVRWSRKPRASPSSVTVSRDRAGRYHVSLVCEVGLDTLPPLEDAVGVDLGVTDFVVLSDGEKVPNPKFLDADLARLRHAHRSLSRKEHGSANWHKHKRRLARMYARVADRRRDFLHKLSTRLVRENQTICLEDLNVQGMMGNRCLARSIGQCGWADFTRMLEYKATLYGRDVVRIGRFEPTSKRCSSCGHRLTDLPLSLREWTCEGCGTRHDRDVNAAKNILTAGLAVRAGDGPCASGGGTTPCTPVGGAATADEGRTS